MEKLYQCGPATKFAEDGMPLCAACGARMGYDSEYCLTCCRGGGQFGKEYIDDVRRLREEYERLSFFGKVWKGGEPDWYQLKEKYGVAFIV